MERAFSVQLFDQRDEEQRLQACRVQRFHLLPELLLRGLDEREHLRGEQRPLLVPLRIAAGLPASARQQDVLDVGLERAFVGLAHD
jgi:hypothetical protein